MVHIQFLGDEKMEKIVRIYDREQTVFCRMTQPDHSQVRRVVLGVHGFGGNSTDEIQAGIAEEMSLFGAATVRFDFPAHGENPENRLTLSGCCDTLLAAARFAKAQYPDVEDLCIFATGFGAYVTLLCLDELVQLPGRVKLVVQTPSVRMDRTLLSMIGRSAETLRVEDRFIVPMERAFEVTYGFYEELRQNVAMDSYPIPMLILQGEKDTYISMDDIQTFRRINEEARLVIIPGASHRFLEPGAWDMVLDLTRDWFEYEQVLLSDWE